MRVHSFRENEWMVWTTSESTWAWHLTPIDDNATRLVSRLHTAYDWRHPLTAIVSVLLMEFGDFAMMRRMLRGIKTRAEHGDRR